MIGMNHSTMHSEIRIKDDFKTKTWVRIKSNNNAYDKLNKNEDHITSANKNTIKPAPKTITKAG